MNDRHHPGHQSLYPQGQGSKYPGKPQSQTGCFGKEINHNSSVVHPVAQLLYWLTLTLFSYEMKPENCHECRSGWCCYQGNNNLKMMHEILFVSQQLYTNKWTHHSRIFTPATNLMAHTTDLPNIINNKSKPVLFTNDDCITVTNSNPTDLKTDITTVFEQVNKWFNIICNQ